MWIYDSQIAGIAPNIAQILGISHKSLIATEQIPQNFENFSHHFDIFRKNATKFL